MFNGQLLFNRVMHVKLVGNYYYINKINTPFKTFEKLLYNLYINKTFIFFQDEKSLPKGDFGPPERPAALPRKSSSKSSHACTAHELKCIYYENKWA